MARIVTLLMLLMPALCFADGPTNAEVLQALGDDKLRKQTLQLISNKYIESQAINDAIPGCLTDNDADTKQIALSLIIERKIKSGTILHKIVAEDKDSITGSLAAKAILATGDQSQQATEALNQSLESFPEQKYRNQQVLRSLAIMPAKALKSVLPTIDALIKRELAQTLIDKENNKSPFATSNRLIVECAPVLAQTKQVKRLIGLLSFPILEVIEAAARALGQIGKSAQPAVPKLQKLALDKAIGSPTIVSALAQIGTPVDSVATTMLTLLKSKDQSLQIAAIKGLAGLKPSFTDRVVTALILEVENEEWKIAKEAVITLGAFGPKAKPAIPILEKLVEKLASTEAEDALKKIRGN